ncbi:MAG: hypothetical protein PHC88_05230 [Terrimicrobiaceae bacterium]|nr:hypothetical protein [Terrimicrobiaceae bacterium]
MVAEHFFPQPWITREQPERDHAVGFAAAHCLREQEDRRTRARAAQMPERSIHQGDHAIGKIVLIEELGAVDFPFEECVEAEHGGTAVSDKDRFARSAE